MSESTREEALAHFGVKGMHWGVRKQSADLSKFSDQGSVLRKGTSIQNLSANQPRKLGGPVYVTHTPKDNLRYRGQYSWVLINRRHADSVYQNAFTAKTDIKIPSERKSVEAFMTLYRKDPKRLIEDVASTQFDLATTKGIWGEIKGQKIYDKAVAGEAKRLSKKGESFVASLDGHDKLSAMLVHDLPSRNSYFQELQKMGFQGVVDRFDTKAGAEHPLIILNGKDVLASGQTKALSENDINLALAKYNDRHA